MDDECTGGTRQAAGVECHTALIVGVGDKLGSALARRFNRAGMRVAMAKRSSDSLAPLVQELAAHGSDACAISCDATDPRAVSHLFDLAQEKFGVPNLVVYNVEHFGPGTILNITPDAFEDCWRANCLGGFLVGREAARLMVGRGHGTIIFTGATASLRGRDGYINLAVGKFGLRALAQSMARELGPKGIHVAHVVLDSGMSALGPDNVAENYLHLHRQPQTAWTHELDLRPWNEHW